MRAEPGLRNGEVPGMAVVAVPDNDILFSKGYGVKKAGHGIYEYRYHP